jgi:hypothetical protein
VTAPTLRADTPVVIVRGKHANKPAFVARVQLHHQSRTVEVILGRTGERVTVRTSSLEVRS